MMSAQTKPSAFWYAWMAIILFGIAGFSLMLLIYPVGAHFLFDWIAFQGDVPVEIETPKVRQYLSFIYGVLGAVMLGWTALFYYILYYPFKAGKRWSWYAFAIPLTLWFTTDSVLSVLSGFWLNAAFNS
ncbi:MAG: hypothetical protein ABJN51_16765, partial [Sneathiella sp.]